MSRCEELDHKIAEFKEQNAALIAALIARVMELENPLPASVTPIRRRRF